ncbi:MAG: peptidoglycan-binding protein [Gammaproteobacteria bacterium]
METAVRAFQQRHGLKQDAAVGKATLAALSVPVEARIDQIRATLERWPMGDARPPPRVRPRQCRGFRCSGYKTGKTHGNRPR